MKARSTTSAGTARSFGSYTSRQLSPSSSECARVLGKKLLCYLGKHRWQRVKAEKGGEEYLKCRDCGKYGELPHRSFVGNGTP